MLCSLLPGELGKELDLAGGERRAFNLFLFVLRLPPSELVFISQKWHWPLPASHSRPVPTTREVGWEQEGGTQFCVVGFY